MSSTLKQIQALKKKLTSLNIAELTKAFDFKDELCRNIEREIEIIIPVALVLHTLSIFPKDLLDQKDKEFIARCVSFLNEEGNKSFSFNYWVRNSLISKKFPVPDDMDDTAISLFSLTSAQADINEKFFFKIIKQEKKPGGPYRTWFVNPEGSAKKWLDIDPVVNANTLYFAAVYGINLFSTERYIKDRLKKGDYRSPYYPYDLMFLFSASRLAGASNQIEFKEIIKSILKEMDFAKLEDMEKLLYLLTSTYVGLDIKKDNLKDVLFLRKKNGYFPPLPYCISFATKDRKPTFSASEVITTSLVLELLIKNLKLKKTVKKPKSNVFIKRLKSQIILEVNEKFDDSKISEMLLGKRFERILLVPIKTAFSIKKKLNETQKENIFNLTIALFFSWAGYTLNDDVIDGGKPMSLKKIADEMVEIGRVYYEKLYKFSLAFEKEIKKAFVDCDRSYEWEVNKTRFNNNNLEKVLNQNWNYEYIEKRMQPYLITMKNIAVFLDQSEKAPDLYKIYKAQVIIDQLDDDAHDWQEDYKNGHMTYVLFLLLSNVEGEDKKLFFWKNTMNKVIQLSKNQYRTAIKSIDKIGPNTDFLLKIINKAYSPIQKAEQGKTQVKKLLRMV